MSPNWFIELQNKLFLFFYTAWRKMTGFKHLTKDSVCTNKQVKQEFMLIPFAF